MATWSLLGFDDFETGYSALHVLNLAYMDTDQDPPTEAYAGNIGLNMGEPNNQSIQVFESRNPDVYIPGWYCWYYGNSIPPTLAQAASDGATAQGNAFLVQPIMAQRA